MGTAVAACGGSSSPSAFNGSPDGAAGADGGGVSSDATVYADAPSLFGNSEAAPACVNLACQQKACTATTQTTVTGTVYAPNGTLPIYNVIVYVPNGALEPIDAGISCDQCGTLASGDPLVTALTDATGKFTLTNVPAGADIPIVVQLGKWRRATKIPMVTACETTVLTDPNLTRLPKNQTEGNMPHIALTTGDCDSVGCMLPKLGIDPAEFGVESDGPSKAIHVYSSGSDGLPGTAQASDLWSNLTLLSTYDMGIFSCECDEAPGTKGNFGGADFAAVTDYLDKGGRIFTTDFQYTWYRYSPDPKLGALSASNLSTTGIGTINGGAPTGDNPINLNTTFPKGLALASWLSTVFPTDAGTNDKYGQVTCDYVFDNIQSLNTEPQVWASSTSTQNPPDGTDPRVFTVNTPAGLPTAQQCGKGVHLDAHINSASQGEADFVGCNGGTCYPATCTNPLKEDEAMFAFFFFDLASCIQNESAPPMPPPPPK